MTSTYTARSASLAKYTRHTTPNTKHTEELNLDLIGNSVKAEAPASYSARNKTPLIGSSNVSRCKVLLPATPAEAWRGRVARTCFSSDGAKAHLQTLQLSCLKAKPPESFECIHAPRHSPLAPNPPTPPTR